ncbi:PDZ domain-containing protein [Microbulbifer sp. SAOS-129_SWC]|uniref:PDZ domain-containing protein n=1 Tax=Microbulbifer sp. SAOS-129_SWC TaxID=3145235 RepID=UPI0032167AD1
MERQYLRQRIAAIYPNAANAVSNHWMKALNESIDYDMYRFLKGKLAPDELARYVAGSGRDTGIIITNVSSNGSAAIAGLQPGDRIVRYNSEPIFNPQNLVTRIRRVPPGQMVKLDFISANGNRRKAVYVPGGRLEIRGGPDRQ